LRSNGDHRLSGTVGRGICDGFSRFVYLTVLTSSSMNEFIPNVAAACGIE
jgi:hypothetical protein